MFKISKISSLYRTISNLVRFTLIKPIKTPKTNQKMRIFIVYKVHPDCQWYKYRKAIEKQLFCETLLGTLKPLHHKTEMAIYKEMGHPNERNDLQIYLLKPELIEYRKDKIKPKKYCLL